MQCPLVLLVLLSVSITTIDLLTLIVLRLIGTHKHAVCAQCSEEISLPRVSTGLGYSNGASVITVAKIKIPLPGVFLQSYRGTLSY